MTRNEAETDCDRDYEPDSTPARRLEGEPADDHGRELEGENEGGEESESEGNPGPGPGPSPNPGPSSGSESDSRSVSVRDPETPTPTPTPTFDTVDWTEYEGSRRLTRRNLVTVCSLCLYVALWAYDHVVRSSHEPLFGLSRLDLTPTNVDWLFGLTLLAGFGAVVVPLWANPRLTRYYWRRIGRNRVAVASFGFLCLVFVAGLVGPFVLGYPEAQWNLGHVPPVGFGGTWAHPFGTTRNGEDVLAITVVGMRVSMQVGLVATAISIGLSTVVGTTAAFVGGRVDAVLMRIVDLVMTFPSFFLVLFLVYVYGGNLFVLILILAVTTWGGQARLIRSEALQRSTETYITAAEAAGASRWFVIRRHVVPNVSNTIITAATLSIPVLILYEAVVAFLGFGDPGVWSWGRIIADGQTELATAWWVSTIPGVFLFLTVLAFNFLGDALRDALDPRHEVNRPR